MKQKQGAKQAHGKKKIRDDLLHRNPKLIVLKYKVSQLKI